METSSKDLKYYKSPFSLGLSLYRNKAKIILSKGKARNTIWDHTLDNNNQVSINPHQNIAKVAPFYMYRVSAEISI